jgi:hypothetical protein
MWGAAKDLFEISGNELSHLNASVTVEDPEKPCLIA